MPDNITATKNHIRMSGAFTETPRYLREEDGKPVWITKIASRRLSGNTDEAVVRITEEQKDTILADPDGHFLLEGDVHTFIERKPEWTPDNKKSRLRIYIRAESVKPEKERKTQDMNRLELEGFLTKPPAIRETPMGKTITDFFLAVNHGNGRSSYLPCICWGGAARYMSRLDTGDMVALEGQFHSRGYEKQLPDGTTQARTAYEMNACAVKKVQADKRKR